MLKLFNLFTTKGGYLATHPGKEREVDKRIPNA